MVTSNYDVLLSGAASSDFELGGSNIVLWQPSGLVVRTRFR